MLRDEAPSTLFRENLSTVDTVISVIILIVLILINLYTIAKLINTIRALVATRCFTNQPVQGGKVNEEPVVTIQICVYNEASVIEDTINAACSVDWPKDKLFVQICDDSTDETTDIIMAVAASWRENGVNCKCLRRPNRIGYKAGNLHYHTNAIQGDFVALFDSDHRAEPSFLRRAIPHFYDDNGEQKHDIGLVQFPWAYYNTHQNLLTEYDALTLDILHVIDQTGRSGILRCFGFNGTGGIWRKEAIQAGGGWQWDTVTEDLDLSYLAHMAGYDLIYLRDLPQQLELPPGIRAHIQQKHRWTKGFFQVMRKSLWNVIKSPRSSLAIKFEAFFHFTAPIGYTLAILIFLLFPIAAYRNLFTGPLSLLGVFPATFPIVCSILAVYVKVPSSNGHYKGFYSRTFRLVVIVPIHCLISLGMCIFETYALLDGLFSNDATFKRTPKEGKATSTAAVEFTEKNTMKTAFLALDNISSDEDLDHDDKEKDADEDDSGNGGTCTGDDEDNDEEQQQVIVQQNVTTVTDATTKKVTTVCSNKNNNKDNINHMIPVKTSRNKSLSKYFKDICLGLSGFVFVGYILFWAFFSFAQRSSNKIVPIQVLILTPVPGLLYIHGLFCYALFRTILTKK